MLCSGHTGLEHREQHFATFLSFVCGHNEHRFLFCNMFSGRDASEKDKPHLTMASFVAFWSWGIFCLVFMWGKMRLSARSVRKRRLEPPVLCWSGCTCIKHLALLHPAGWRRVSATIVEFVFCKYTFQPFDQLGQHRSSSCSKAWWSLVYFCGLLRQCLFRGASYLTVSQLCFLGGRNWPL